MLLLFLFIGVPLIEIALFVQLGSVLDLGWILLIVVATAMLGAWLVRRQGRGVLRQIQGALEDLGDPTEPLAHGAMVLFSGALLLTPGFFTDTIGFLLLIPAVRVAVLRWVRRRVVVHDVRMGGRMGGGPGFPPRDAGSEGDVIDGDYRDLGQQGSPRRDASRPSGWTRDG